MRVTFVIALLSPAIAGCYLPVNYKEPASPKLIGVYRRADGAPAAGARLAVTSHQDDSTCARAAVHTTADSDGRFVLDSSEIQRHGLLLFPAFEHFANSYWVCAASSDSAFHVALNNSLWFGRDSGKPDTVVCQDYHWESRARAVCSSVKEPTLVTGGSWSDSTGSGIYRLILTEIGPLHGSDGDFLRPRLLVQWVQQAQGAPDTVRMTLALPTDKKFRNLHRLWLPRVWRHDTVGWCVSVLSSRMSFLDSNRQEEIGYALGAPGEARPEAACLLADHS